MNASELFPKPPVDHKTVVRVVEVPIDPTEWAYLGTCRACAWKSEAPRASYESAWWDCFQHRQAMDDLAQPGWFGKYFD